jgi:hypothetical protein
MMQYLVCVVLGICSTQCKLEIIACNDRKGWLNFLFIGDGRVEDEEEREETNFFERLGLKKISCQRQLYHPQYHRSGPVRLPNQRILIVI